MIKMHREKVAFRALGGESRVWLTILSLAFTGIVISACTESYSTEAYDFTIIDVPNRDGVFGFTTLVDINDEREIVGEFTTGNHGFLIDSNGFVTRIQCPLARTTIVRGINNSGELSGSCRYDKLYGFVRSRDGNYIWIDHPEATMTEAGKLNNNKHVVGTYRGMKDIFNGFEWANDHFKDLRPEIPKAVLVSATAVNKFGDVVGSFRDSSDGRHGFVKQSGATTTLDFPGSRSTLAEDINDAGTVVGRYVDFNGRSHGFIYENGVYGVIDAPFPNMLHTDLFGINNHGEIVGRFVIHGRYFDGKIASRGFVAAPKKRNVMPNR